MRLPRSGRERQPRSGATCTVSCAGSPSVNISAEGPRGGAAPNFPNPRLNVNLDAVLPEHLDHFREVRRPGWDLAVQGGEHRNRMTAFSSDFQDFTATRAIAKRMNGAGGNMHE